MRKMTDSFKKVILAGIGAMTTTTDKSKDLLDEMIKKGELTVAQGKILNQELKHNLKETLKNKKSDEENLSTLEELQNKLQKMTPEEMELLKSFIQEMETNTEKHTEEQDIVRFDASEFGEE